MTDIAIEIQGLRKTYGELVALAGLSLAVARGEVFALLGPDGAGKTTTMRLLAGILAPSGGSARVLGLDVFRQAEGLKRRIGYMPQRFALYGDLTVAENLRFFASIYGVPRAERLAREAELLEFSRLGPFRDRLAMYLSGGMKQKLALACTLMHSPEVLFLDEPTAGVDPVSRREFWRILYRLAGQGVTLFLSTPYMDEAERCARVAMLDRGGLALCGTPGELKAGLRGAILEVIAEPPREAKARLAALPGVRDVHIFGERLHVWLETPDAEATVAAALDGLTLIALRRIAPGLEDVFNALAAGEGEA
ncbi:MAG TPA: ABC transporter ATP-binding protein [Armatimonadota bacterium]|nr:ABC transporter ATP-binding protein [Armatimonadota bacterium]HOS42142.1 ABC transporter ATP-binding protein [Armatimonadota bacterium]